MRSPRSRRLTARGESLASHRDGRGAPPARRDDREYREYLSEEQRSRRGCIARRMQPDFHHGLLGRLSQFLDRHPAQPRAQCRGLGWIRAAFLRDAGALAARGESLAAFDGRCILAGCVAPPLNTPGIRGRRALPARRLARLGAPPHFHHGLLALFAFDRLLLPPPRDATENRPHPDTLLLHPLRLN